MATVVREGVSVTTSDHLLVIHHDQLWDDGDNMGGDFVCEASAATWLADKIEEVAGPTGSAKITQTIAPDHFIVYVGGGERDPNVHVQNLRDPEAPRGKKYVLVGMDMPVAKQLVRDLRALKP